MVIQGIDGVLQQLQATASQSASRNESENRQSLPYHGADFVSELRSALNHISETQQTARLQAQKFSLDAPGVSLNDVMVDLQKSSISLQLGIQVRNKLVAAYQDIMSMQV